MTFRDFADEWLAMRPLRPTTLLKYEQFLRLNIKPRIGDRTLAAIRPSHVQAMIAALNERLSPAVVRSNVVLTSSILKAAPALAPARARRWASPATGSTSCGVSSASTVTW